MTESFRQPQFTTGRGINVNLDEPAIYGITQEAQAYYRGALGDAGVDLPRGTEIFVMYARPDVLSLTERELQGGARMPEQSRNLSGITAETGVFLQIMRERGHTGPIAVIVPYITEDGRYQLHGGSLLQITRVMVSMLDERGNTQLRIVDARSARSVGVPTPWGLGNRGQGSLSFSPDVFTDNYDLHLRPATPAEEGRVGE
jgi:hypothetical protein